MRRDTLVDWLDAYLDIAGFEDPSLNGLQVEGAEEVEKIAVAVDGSLAAIERAIEADAQMLLVHHGLFWGKPLPVRNMLRRRLAHLLHHDVNLYAAHLPLDAHEDVGNNWGLARRLGLNDLAWFARIGGRPAGVKGVFAEPMSLRALADLLEKELGESVLVHAGGPGEVRTLGIVTGGAAREVSTAADEGLDAFLTGEPKHDTFHHAFERGINALFAGHYMTETVGVQLLAQRLEKELGVATEFLLLPTGL